MRKCCHAAIRPINWLVGRWTTSSGQVLYPTMKPVPYNSEIIFDSMGQPLLNYSMDTWDPQKRSPMHLERGFLRIKPGTNEIAFMVAHNLGVTTLEEGEVSENEVICKSVGLSNMSFVRDPLTKNIERIFRLHENGSLEVLVSMETVGTPMATHLKAVYEKVK